MNKNLYVRDLATKVGSEIQDCFLVLDKRNRLTRKGTPYWELDLADSSGQIAGRIWSCYEQAGHNFESGHIIELVATVETYAGVTQLNVQRFRRLRPEDVDIAQFPKGTTGEPDEFAKVTSHGVASGEWVYTDKSAQIKLATESKMEELKRRLLAGAMPKLPVKLATRTAPLAKVQEKPEEHGKRFEELKRKYSRNTPEKDA